MLPTLFFELSDVQQNQRQTKAEQDQQPVEKTETETAKEILNKMPESARQFARSVNVKFSNLMKNPPGKFQSKAEDIIKNINEYNEKGDIGSLIVEIDMFKNYMQEIASQFDTLRTNALDSTLKEEPFASMDKTSIRENKQNILDYLAASRNSYSGIEEMNNITTNILKTLNDFDYSNAGVKKPDLTNVVNELTNTILDNKDNIQETEKMMQGLLDESGIDAKNIEDVKKDVEKNNNVETKEGLSLSSITEPKPLSDAVKKLEKNLTDFDKNVLLNYYNEQNFGSYVKDDLVTAACTNKMTPDAIVILCAMALNKAFPDEGVGVKDDDIDFRMEDIKYSGGSSNAVIRYSIPEESKDAEFDTDNKRFGGDIDSQWLEARISPDVEMKQGKGRAELVTRTFDKDDASKLVTQRGKIKSVVEFIKQVIEASGRNGGKKSSYRW